MDQNIHCSGKSPFQRWEFNDIADKACFREKNSFSESMKKSDCADPRRHSGPVGVFGKLRPLPPFITQN